MSRIAVLLTALSLLVAACAPGAGEPTAAGSPQGLSPTAPATPPATTAPPTALPTLEPTATPFEFGELDEELVAEYQALGLSETEAIFASLTRGDTVALGDHRYLITEHYPTGNSGEIEITLTPDQTADPEAAGSVAIEHSETETEWLFTLSYFVPYDDIPADVQEQIRSGSTAALGPLLALAGGSSDAIFVAESKSGVQVVAEAVIKKYTVDSVKGFIRYLDAVLGTGVQVDQFYKSISAALSVKDAWAMKSEFDEFDRKLKALEQCVEHPTNPITRRTYREHPEEKQRVLDQIKAAREEIKANTAVSFLNTLIKTGSALIKNVPWLSWVIGPASAWSKNALREVSERLIRDVEKNVVPCDAYQFHFKGSGTALTFGESVPIDWEYWGVLCSEAEEWQIWEGFDGVQQNSGTGPPGGDPYGPIRTKFDENGEVSESTWAPLGNLLFHPSLGGTLQGTVDLRLFPDAEKPTELHVTIREGEGSPINLVVPVEPRDGSFGECPEDET